MATEAAQRWRRTTFNDLQLQMGTPLRSELRLPILLSPHLRGANVRDDTNATTGSLVPSPLTVGVQLHTNSSAVQQFWQRAHHGFIHAPAQSPSPPCANEPVTTISSEVFVHAGPPATLGYPATIDLEATAWTDGVMQEESVSYQRVMEGQPPLPSSTSPMTRVRWLHQLLLDGYVAQRVEAHTGVTTASMLHSRDMAAWLGQFTPPHRRSPFFTADHLLSRWGVFGESHSVTPNDKDSAPEAAGDHAEHTLRLLLQLALVGSLISPYHGVWLRGSALTHRRTGESVLLLGPRRSGKTTLALHCLAANADLALTAAEDVCLVPGAAAAPAMCAAEDSASRLWSHANCFLTAGVPQRVEVGLGAVLGTLRPSPALASSLQTSSFAHDQAAMRSLLRNSDWTLWNMSQCYAVHVAESFPHSLQPWAPVVLGPLRGVVLLNWDLQELQRTGPYTVRSSAVTLPLLDEGLGLLAEQYHRDPRSIVKGHYLVRSHYNEQDGWGRLCELLHHQLTDGTSQTEQEHHLPVVTQLQGSVDFDLAVEHVLRLLKA